MDYVLHGISAVQFALIYRCFMQTEGGVESGTLMEDEMAKRMNELLAGVNDLKEDN